MDYFTENNRSIGHRMRQVRQHAHMTQEQLADTLGVTVNYLGEVERGRKPLSLTLASQFCQHFNVTYDYLYRGTPPKKQNQIRERSVYETMRDLLQEKLTNCSPEELLVISHLVASYLDASRQIYSHHTPQNHDHCQEHTTPQIRTNDLS
jgi:DNA-binding XRE family transcriptional regulator